MQYNIQPSVHILLHNPKYLRLRNIQEPNLGFIASSQVPDVQHKCPMHLTHAIHVFSLNKRLYPHV